MRLAYLHGFASGPQSKKATHLSRALAARGGELAVPDLNLPSFERLRLTAILDGVDAMDRERGDEDGWGLIGSSLGGWVAARWAELNPGRVHRLLLLCPAFDIPSRWPELLPAGGLALWRRAGALPFADGEGTMRKVHYGFFEEAAELPPFPEVPCETVIVHGRADDRVPFATSEAYAEARPHVRLVAVDDGHDLGASIGEIESLVLDWLA